MKNKERLREESLKRKIELHAYRNDRLNKIKSELDDMKKYIKHRTNQFIDAVEAVLDAYQSDRSK